MRMDVKDTMRTASAGPSVYQGRTRRAAAALAWCLVFLGLGWVGMFIHLEWFPSLLRDPEYGTKAVHLRRLQQQNPGRPLVVILGSSRCTYGVQPDAMLEGLPAEQPRPLVFNLSLFGAGPLMELLCLNRLLSAGVRPDAIVVEYWPPVLSQREDCAEEKRIDPSRLSWSDLRLLARYWSDPHDLRTQFREERLDPFFSYRFAIVSRFAEAWLPVALRRPYPWYTMDAGGWMPNIHEPNAPPAERARRVAAVRKFYGPILEKFHVSGLSDRALQDLLKVCQRERIAVVLLRMPEGTEFRGLYSPQTSAEADTYLAHIAAEYAVPVLDARLWAPDPDFSDSFHLLPNGAAAFSRRLGAEALPRIMDALHGRK
jgi:hypothetical protein